MTTAPFPYTTKRIIEELERSYEPLTINELAQRIEVTGQTVRNNIEVAISAGIVMLAKYKKGNASAYALNNGTAFQSLLPHLIIDGSPKLLRDFFIANCNDTSVAQSDPNINKLFSRVAWLYILTVLFAEHSSTIKYSEKVTRLKEQRRKLREHRNSMRTLIEMCDSLLNNEKLWEPKELIKQLLILDEEIDEETIRSLLDKAGITIPEMN